MPGEGVCVSAYRRRRARDEEREMKGLVDRNRFLDINPFPFPQGIFPCLTFPLFFRSFVLFFSFSSVNLFSGWRIIKCIYYFVYSTYTKATYHFSQFHVHAARSLAIIASVYSFVLALPPRSPVIVFPSAIVYKCETTSYLSTKKEKKRNSAVNVPRALPSQSCPQIRSAPCVC